MLDKETGEVLKSSDCFMNAGFNLIPVTYADGMIFVPLGGGIQCFNASTLESLWCYKGRKVPVTARSVMTTEGFMWDSSRVISCV